MGKFLLGNTTWGPYPYGDGGQAIGITLESPYTLHAQPPPNYTFVGWTESYGVSVAANSSTTTVTFSQSADSTCVGDLTVFYDAEINITSSPPGEGLVSVDGNPQTTPVTFLVSSGLVGNWEDNTTHTLSANSPNCGNGCQTTWGNWSDAGTQSHIITVYMNQSATYTANFQSVEYKLTVTSQYGSPSPSSNWYDSGSVVNASVVSPVSGGNSGIQYVCTGWTGGGSVPSSGSGCSVIFTLTSPSSITWNWKIQYYYLTLSAGWNLVSLPVIPKNPAIGSVLSQELALHEVVSVWSYNTATKTWQSYLPGKASSLTTMVDGKGYWIYMRTADVLTVNGAVFGSSSAPATYSLVTGWNLVGFKPQPVVTNETVGQYLASISGKYAVNSIWVHDNLGGQWIRADSVYALQPGQAMWILITAPATLKP